MKNLKKKRLIDRTAHWGITLGGAVVIIVILALFIFIFLEVFPLLKGANVLKENTFSLRDKPVSVGLDEYQEIAYAIYEDGNIDFISLSDGKLIKEHSIKGIERSSITAICKDRDRIIIGTADGRVLMVNINFSVSFENDERIITPEISDQEVKHTDEERKRIRYITSKSDEKVTVTVFYSKDGKLKLKSTEIEENLFGGEKKNEIITDITAILEKAIPDDTTGQRKKPQITSLAIDYFLENLYIGTSHGEVIHINMREKENPFLEEKVKVSEESITSLGFLLGDVSLVAGDRNGGISTWMRVRDEAKPTGWALKKIHIIEQHQSDITSIASSIRNKCFVTASSDGTIHLKHATSEQTLLRLISKAKPTAIAYSPKANGILAADAAGNLTHWRISNPHPETTIKTLFGKIWYEGYEEPEYSWQSTGGTDDFEPKLSLVPLIFGTIKGTIYAMIIAIPIGILSALYTSQFLHNSLKKIIKPAIEFMAALPSVILGFLAGLWLAPLMEKIFPAIIVMPLFLLLFITMAFCIWKCIPGYIKGKYSNGAETLFLIPFFIAAISASIYLSGPFESFLFMGDYRQWILDILGLQYDQRNAVVVGFAMGFAVLPIIFTISEDAMSNVPRNLTSASLALGAVPWQTAVKIVLPIASPAIFSAVMLGFGRAVGETMVVLMATGNTPIMDWNFFNGFRALAANIAVEIPEAPVGGTLYRVLFLAALLLFITTFIVNTIAELIRQKIKKKYSHL
ncbi:phosphate ABC transporter permease [Candidatus Scalindua japonica]|uniref:Phosphate ABC transporter permease n=1 Tax=Candidatus Scalindua japonica TaxID=1284222 RepID=A0A286TVQ4_9BACT|nr:ABC transporter permease subunit [Candidatus Scalindua japonica]GAX59980.1 phosphate ABC transporter permease [Candidatus Scalindua japonica]